MRDKRLRNTWDFAQIFSGPVTSSLRQKSIKGRTTRHWLTHFFVMISTCRRESQRHFHDGAEVEREDFPFPLRKVAEHALDLHYLAHAKPEICQNIVRHEDNSLIHCLAECCENVLYGHVDLTRNQKQRLVPYRECMREVVKRKVPVKQKKSYKWEDFFRHFSVLWRVPSYYPWLRKFWALYESINRITFTGKISFARRHRDGAHQDVLSGGTSNIGESGKTAGHSGSPTHQIPPTRRRHAILLDRPTDRRRRTTKR